MPVPGTWGYTQSQTSKGMSRAPKNDDDDSRPSPGKGGKPYRPRRRYPRRKSRNLCLGVSTAHPRDTHHPVGGIAERDDASGTTPHREQSVLVRGGAAGANRRSHGRACPSANREGRVPRLPRKARPSGAGCATPLRLSHSFSLLCHAPHSSPGRGNTGPGGEGSLDRV